MSIENEKVEFDFIKEIKRTIVIKPAMSPELIKNLKFSAFLLIGGLALGSGIGLTNGYMQGYKVDRESHAHIAELQAKNDELRKSKKFEIDSVISAKQAQFAADEKRKQEAELSSLNIEKEKAAYKTLLNNKEDLITNYENQLVIYDKAYSDAVKGVKQGSISLDDLDNIRGYYQEYKKNIHEYITFINDTSSSFASFHNLNEENKKILNEELVLYQSGGLHRNSDLSNLLISKFTDDKDAEVTNKNLANQRNTARNEIIDDLNNTNTTTKLKKLK
jgi:hypothetical protein